MDYTLFGHPESGHSYKVKLALEVAQIPHHYQVIDIGLPHLRVTRRFDARSCPEDSLVWFERPYDADTLLAQPTRA